jgi:hypothetical protein
MVIRNKTDEVFSLNLLDTNRNGDQHFEIAVVCGRYSASENVWIMPDEWKSFLRQLHTLEGLRQGTARLQGVTEKDLTLIVRSIDIAGHMAIEGRIGGRRYFGGHLSEVGLEFGFEFDAGTLADLVKACNTISRVG